MKINSKEEMFSNKDLKNLIIPLFLEQLLTILVGLADTFVISFVGEAAVSGVSLVNSFNTIFIFLFTALASGGAVIVSQYIGSKKTAEAGEGASQLLMISTVFSAGIVILLLMFGRPILGLVFGRVEEGVMEACVTYLRISAYSYPALAVYNAGAALYRSIGKTSVTMYIAVVSNVINVVGNLIGVFVLHAGVAGVAYPSLLARLFSAAAVTLLFSVVWNTAVFALTPVIMPFFDVAPETRSLTVWLVLIHNIFNCIAFPFADLLGKGLRAAGNVKFTVVWSLITTIGVRLLSSILFAIVFDMGVIGIAFAMSLDWCVRAVVFYIRFRSGKWKNYQLI